ncbi:MAG: endo-1,4-beta-xylanase [Chloroflexi bacterium]|nr:endo-1,4-beta-xylanase [Chloroflexota bacterium]
MITKMSKLTILLFLIVSLMPAVGLINAQESSFSLRGLAAQNDIYVGAAVWTNHLDDPVHQDVLGREFNMLTPEHEAKFCMISTARGEYDFSKVDQLVEFAEANDMVIHGHTLIWHSCSPDWVENGDFSREEAIEILREHITTVVSRYKGRIAYWDVVNEAFDGAALRDTAWLRFIGEDYIEMAFQFAHEADPDALLLYNDYGAEGMGGKSNAIYAMAQDFLARGIPLHGIGMQSHFDVGSINFTAIGQNIQRLGELGLEVQFTEVDIKYLGETDDEILRHQARDYYRLMETCLDAENCTAFIVWGVTDKFTWLRDASFFDNPTVEPLLFSDEYEPKPAYFALMSLLAQRAGVTPILSESELTAILEDAPAAASVLPEPTKTDPAQLAPDAANGLAYYAPFNVTITLDGDLSDWENVPRVTVDSGTTVPAGNDTSFEFAVAADDANLYYMADVTDSIVVYGNYEAGEWYREDSVELYLNTTGDLGAAAYQPGIVQIGIMAGNLTQPETPLVGGSNNGDSQISFVVVETEKGYVIEASVPLKTDVWDIVPEHLGVLGFQTHLNGSAATDRDTKLIWSAADTQDQSWNNPSLFGQLIFWDKAQ